MPTFPLILTKEEHATLKRRASEANLSINKFLKSIAIDGKLPKSRK